MAQASSVSINLEGLDHFVEELVPELERIKTSKEAANANALPGEDSAQYVDWDACGWHYCEDREDKGGNGENTVQYIFVLDCLNWCFWPTEEFEYEQLAVSLKNVLLQDPNVFDADRLAKLKMEELEQWFLPYTIPMADERVQKVNELGAKLLKSFEGKAMNVVRAAENSATKLVDLVVESFPGFRDHAVYKGRQVFFYKRAQILVGDIWAAFGRKCNQTITGSGMLRHPCDFPDIVELTMFADYRVPQLLREEGLITYNEALATKVNNKSLLPPGSEEEIEIRAATVHAVEMMVSRCKVMGLSITSVELDWLLWQRGEERLKTMRPHHRTLTVYY
jgi:hypothetical protein